jgi:endonuclease-8
VPEGDIIHRTAQRLAPVLTGRPVVRFRAARLAQRGPVPGTLIEGVEAQGKYLLVHFADGTVLETHMRMTGSWHLYRPGERWRRSPRAARAVIETGEWVAVCFSAPHVVLRPRGGDAGAAGRGRAGVGHLGPDLCSPDPDFGEVERRLEQLAVPGTPIVDVLVDQRLFCGVGNVYKSEVLFAVGIHPDTPLGQLGPDRRRQLIGTAHRLLRANLGGGDRVTVPGGLAVYGRKGEACRACGTMVERGLRGPHHRSTYWCPRCQPAPVTGLGSDGRAAGSDGRAAGSDGRRD